MRPTTTLSILLFVALHIGSAQTVIEDRWVLADGGSDYDWLDDIASQNATQNLGLSDDEVLAIIEQARAEAAE